MQQTSSFKLFIYFLMLIISCIINLVLLFKLHTCISWARIYTFFWQMITPKSTFCKTTLIKHETLHWYITWAWYYTVELKEITSWYLVSMYKT
jgi:hypothetical protein